jgi:nucleotide sugar dehydrogenase
MKPDRVVIGVDKGDERAGEMMQELYAAFTRTGAPIMVMDTASAELCKYAANAILATRISFMNEVANVCELVGADVDQVRKAMGADRRIGTSFLFPGVGYGGSCFPKDVKALAKSAKDRGYDFKILNAVESVNQTQKERLVAKMERHFTELSGKTIALWGLAFRAPTTCARRRRFRSSSGCSRTAPVCAPTIRRPHRWRGASSTAASACARTATTRWPAPTRSRSSPSGTSSAIRTSRRCDRF